jgi:hypothetical protein
VLYLQLFRKLKDETPRTSKQMKSKSSPLTLAPSEVALHHSDIIVDTVSFSEFPYFNHSRPVTHVSLSLQVWSRLLFHGRRMMMRRLAVAVGESSEFSDVSTTAVSVDTSSANSAPTS